MEIKCKECGAILDQEYINRWKCKQCNRTYYASELMEDAE